MIKIKVKEKKQFFNISNRRYIGSKQKLSDWIFNSILENCKNCKSFTDIFAGTGVISSESLKYFDEININDFLYSNNAIYNAFFMNGDYNKNKLLKITNTFNTFNKLEENFFSTHFGGKYFSFDTSRKIGMIREYLEKNKYQFTEKEYYILIASLIYSMDKVANTVGHFDAYFKKENIIDNFQFNLIQPLENTKKIQIFREDANVLSKTLISDITYIDPPYNSRQYSRFYHLYETLVKWDKSELFGVALKPKPENISEYCKVSAKFKFEELINSLRSKYLVISYNNTYNSKSHSSKNKITLEEIENILNKVGETKIFEQKHKEFNTGKTEFDDHREILFITKVNSEK
jgi:adenine-specific DNA-methyltransferase